MSLNCWSDSDQKAVRKQLDRVLHSGPFAHSRRRQRFLEYVVNETLAGRGERLKGYNVGIEVFDRPESFDPAVDPIVRIEAARVREKLREYYDTEGLNDPIRIELPKGTYTPQIEISAGGSCRGVQRAAHNDAREADSIRKTADGRHGQRGTFARGIRRLDLVQAARAADRKSFDRCPAIREYRQRDAMGSLRGRPHRGHRHRPIAFEGPVRRRAQFNRSL